MQNRDEILKMLKDFAKNCTKEKAMEMLVASGIYDKDGNLTDEYK